MPGSQENRWHGFRSEAEYIEAQHTWDGVVRAFERVVNSFRGMRPVVVEAESSIRDYNTALQEDPVLDLRRGEYPGWDGYGTYWYDRTGIHSNAAGVCFVCRTSTQRMDIDLRRHFCNSAECNRQIAEKK